MSVLLVQHGKSLPKEQDPERGLSREGIHDVERIGEVARGIRSACGIPFYTAEKKGRNRPLKSLPPH